MAVAFKVLMGAGAIWSVLIIAASERTAPPVIENALPIVEQSFFDDRYPFVIVTRKQDRDRTAALPSVQEPLQASAEAKVRKVNNGHNAKPPVTCKRRHFYTKGHRYWSCRRGK
jgi:hypothetical protein